MMCLIQQGDEKSQRLEQACRWLDRLDLNRQSGFVMVAGDASFRSYFRIQIDGCSSILMDAPPPAEDVRPFIDVCHRLRAIGLHAPEIYHADPANGLLLLEDLGDNLYRELLDEKTVKSHFNDLFKVLRQMALQADTVDLPNFDADLMLGELNLFPDWYLQHHRSHMSRTQFDQVWLPFCDQLITSALDQPQCFVHRDFHSCNLLKTPANTVGIIDFQDAVRGPISYDLISLLWDRYISWPRGQIEGWMESFRMMLDLDIPPQRWQRYCDLMGLQRHIKVVGIFARLYYRDGKNGYLEMIPRFYEYVTETLRRYPEFEELANILEQDECVP